MRSHFTFFAYTNRNVRFHAHTHTHTHAHTCSRANGRIIESNQVVLLFFFFYCNLFCFWYYNLFKWFEKKNFFKNSKPVARKTSMTLWVAFVYVFRFIFKNENFLTFFWFTTFWVFLKFLGVVKKKNH